MSSPVNADEIENGLKLCADAFGQLAALLEVIREKAPEHSDVAKLAALASSVAFDMGNFADVMRGDVQDRGVQA